MNIVPPDRCPECFEPRRPSDTLKNFENHWRNNHENIMPYEEALLLIKEGKCPSRELSGY